jgi:hypothetical protein
VNLLYSTQIESCELKFSLTSKLGEIKHKKKSTHPFCVVVSSYFPLSSSSPSSSLKDVLCFRNKEPRRRRRRVAGIDAKKRSNFSRSD